MDERTKFIKKVIKCPFADEYVTENECDFFLLDADFTALGFLSSLSFFRIQPNGHELK